jgi:uncharacterized protein
MTDAATRTMAGLEVRDRPDRSRYEALLDGDMVGFSSYRILGEVISFTHANVLPEYCGRGIASEMARVSLDDVRATGTRRVRAVCSFYSWYISHHPEYADLLAE